MDAHERLTSHDPTAARSGRPFPNAQSQMLLDGRRFNTSHLTDTTSILNTDDAPGKMATERRTSLQATPRISLTHLLSTSGSRRSSTPLAPSMHIAQRTDRPGSERLLGHMLSSPALASDGSPESAYSQVRRRISPAGRVQDVLQLSTLQGPSHPLQTNNESPGVNKNARGEDDMIQYITSAMSRNKDLQKENEHLESMNFQLTREVEDARSRLVSLETQLASANAEIQVMRPSLASVREQLASSETEIAALKSQSLHNKSELTSLAADQKSLQETHAQERSENDRLRNTISTTKESIAKLKIEYATVDSNLRDLKRAYITLQSSHQSLVKEAEGSKALAAQGLAALRPLLDDENTMTRVAETKAVLKELQADLMASQQVTDLLRNKLHHQGSQLADAHSRIRELEDEKRGVTQEFLRARQEGKEEFDAIVSVEKKVEELFTRLSIREQESIDALSSAATTEVQLQAALEKIDVQQREIDAQILELGSLRTLKSENVSKLLNSQDIINARDKEIISLKAEIKSLSESKAELRALLAESKKALADKDSELHASGPIIHALERDVAHLNANIVLMQQSKEDLQLVLDNTKKVLAEKTDLILPFEQLQLKNKDLSSNLRDMEAKCATLQTALELSQEQYVALERLSNQQSDELRKKISETEKLNVESATQISYLKSSLSDATEEVKKLHGELHDAVDTASSATARCVILEKTEKEYRNSVLAEIAAAKTKEQELGDQLKAASIEVATANGKYVSLESALKKLDSASKGTQDRLIAEVAHLKARLEDQSTALFRAKDQCGMLKEEVATLKGHIATRDNQLDNLQANLKSAQLLAKSEEKRAVVIENSLASSHFQADETKKALEEAQLQVRAVTEELQRLKESANVFEHSLLVENDDRIRELKHLIAELQHQNSALATNADEILARYKKGRLTDREKEFIGYLMRETQSIYEEDVIKKDNELKRREHTIADLNSKVSELQKVVARVLKGRDRQIEQQNSLVNIKAWLSSSPAHADGNDEDEDKTAELIARANAAQPQDDHDSDALSDLSKLPDSPAPEYRNGTKRTRSPSLPAETEAEELNQPKRRTKKSTGTRATRGLNANVAAPEVKSTASGKMKKRQRK